MRRVIAAVVALSFVVVGCSGGADLEPATTVTLSPETTGAPQTTATTRPPESSTTSTEAGPAVGTLSEFRGMLATLTVPLDHDDPDSPAIEAPVWRREATDPDKRVGVLLVNPGGPGFPGEFLVRDPSAYTERLRQYFDIVALDPRGTYPATDVNCQDGFAEYVGGVDWSPDAPGELEAAVAWVEEQVEQCFEEYGELPLHVSTTDTVRDMALLVEALGEEQVSYFGYSYGTVLGATFVALFPELVRAAVFDGAYEPAGYGDLLQQELDSVAALEDFFVRLLDECDSDADCPIQGGAQAAFTRVAAAADAEPLSSSDLFPPVNELAFFVTIRLDPATYGGPTNRLLSAVAEADAGDSTSLQILFNEAVQLIEFSGSNLAISCIDFPYRGLAPFPDDALDRVREAGPTLDAIFPTPEGFDPYQIPGECEIWPAGSDPLPDTFAVDGSGPVLVVSSTGDPVTPTASAIQLESELNNSTLLLVEDDEHTSYRTFAGGKEALRCATEAIDDFLINLQLPPEGTVCRP